MASSHEIDKAPGEVSREVLLRIALVDLQSIDQQFI